MPSTMPCWMHPFKASLRHPRPRQPITGVSERYRKVGRASRERSESCDHEGLKQPETTISTSLTEVWRRDSMVASWLLDLTASASLKDPTLSQFAGRVSDSGEGRWTIKAPSTRPCRCLPQPFTND